MDKLHVFTFEINFYLAKQRANFKKEFPAQGKKNIQISKNIQIIIDCAEFKTDTPSSLVLHKMMYSDYKSHKTVKNLVGIAPGGGFTFISNTYPGSISDKEIVVKSGFLNPNLWEQGDIVMVDRGFLIEYYLKPLGVGLEIPNFLKGRDQLTIKETVKSHQIANEKIIVERMIQRLKCYYIFDRLSPINMLESLNQIIYVCALLSNFLLLFFYYCF